MTPNTDLANRIQHLRQELRQKRRALTYAEQTAASHNLCRQLQKLSSEQRIENVAGYIAANGEISLAPYFHWCWQQQIQVYVPVLHPFSKGHLLFLSYSQHTPLTRNRYNLEEPVLDVSKVIAHRHIDLLLTPLLGFDCHGNRLGMGGGYYDRTLHACPNLQNRAIGVAHRCQQVEHLQPQPWDIPLKQIISA
ncbi:5-formyltetrahydrofolate cyclo-ligase [Thalassotalea mangrovi]|uniref:5-formyltetrahydrofolate cyclo-ligase n=1 Tax=Thalassotalea mangrovi TaxID=2572245 RepID=A0A4U1BAB6_9GAMM|nr:5-formyltetrahydrofolate cyclo-ligase [Thalassotalea mangrovi]TKB47703.1 5-formyltetrahydrofolate cyclo-ligase [Thalassotalea mangrovi]